MKTDERSSFLLALAFVALCSGMPACNSESSCADDREAVERCGRAYTADVCSTPEDRCATACFARASCDELDAIDQGESPLWLVLCFATCGETFECPDGTVIDAWWVCDGEEDCITGADERACNYFTCTDGTLIREDFECDEWHDCADRSDEAECGYFLCHDNGHTVAQTEECDGTADCADGSDEGRCP